MDRIIQYVALVTCSFIHAIAYIRISVLSHTRHHRTIPEQSSPREGDWLRGSVSIRKEEDGWGLSLAQSPGDLLAEALSWAAARPTGSLQFRSAGGVWAWVRTKVTSSSLACTCFILSLHQRVRHSPGTGTSPNTPHTSNGCVCLWCAGSFVGKSTRASGAIMAVLTEDGRGHELNG